MLHVRVAVWPWLFLSALWTALGGNGCTTSSENSSGAGSDGGAEESETGADATSGSSIFPTSDASACRPGDVQTYQPSDYHFAAPAWRGVCDVEGPTGNGQDRLFFDKCLAPDSTPDGCAAFLADPANAACAKCILTSDSTMDHEGYGPLINHGTFITTNVAGCIELTDPSAISCAKVVQALSGCELRACEANCPVHDQASRAAYDACASHADHGGCQPYATAAACTNAEESRAPLCLLPSFMDFYYAVVPLFCGSPPKPDGGPVFGFDAADSDAAVDDGANVEAGAALQTDAPADALADTKADAILDAGVDAAAADHRGASPEPRASDAAATQD